VRLEALIEEIQSERGRLIELKEKIDSRDRQSPADANGG
jgi:hypothetical protein